MWYLILMKITWQNFILLSLILFSVNAQSTSIKMSKVDVNKKVVTDFYVTAFNKHMPAEAMQKYVGATYLQHNPFVADGKQPFIDFFLNFQKKHPEAHASIKRVIAQGDLVVVHVHSKIDNQDQGRAVMDIFRLENGKIMEHWDVAQPIPEKSANTNTMF